MLTEQDAPIALVLTIGLVERALGDRALVGTQRPGSAPLKARKVVVVSHGFS
jgi:hypothetical protein